MRPAAVIGIDPSADQLAFAEKRATLAMAEFRVGDAQDLPFPDSSFDMAVMALVVHFLPDPARAVAEMARARRPGRSLRVGLHEGRISGGAPSRRDESDGPRTTRSAEPERDVIAGA